MKLEELKKKYEEMGKEIEKLERKEEFKEGEIFWGINLYGKVASQEYHNSYFCKNLIELGNAFHTKEDAEKELKKRKIKAKLERYAEEHNDKIDWEDSNAYKYFIIYYNYDNKKIEYGSYYQYKIQGTIYFSSKKIAQNAVKEIGEDNIIFLIKE